MRAVQALENDQGPRWVIVEHDGWSPESCEMVERWLRHLENREYSPNTVRSYARDLTHHLRYLEREGLTVNDFRPRHADSFLNYLVKLPVRLTGGKQRTLAVVVPDQDGRPARKRAGSSVNRAMAATSSFYEFAITVEAYSHENPIVVVPDTAQRRVSKRHKPFMGRASRQQPVRRAMKVKTPRLLPRPLSEDQVDAVLGSMRTLRDKALFLIMLDGGLRPGEALGIQIPHDVEFGRRRVWVRHRGDEHPKGVRQKSREDRVVDLSEPRTLAAINAYIMFERPRESGSSYLFLIRHGRRHGEPLSAGAWNRLWGRHTEALGIRAPWLTPHALRHTHATAMSDGGMSDFALQERLGHASPESTRIYTRVSNKRVKAEYEQVMSQRLREEEGA